MLKHEVLLWAVLTGIAPHLDLLRGLRLTPDIQRLAVKARRAVQAVDATRPGDACALRALQAGDRRADPPFASFREEADNVYGRTARLWNQHIEGGPPNERDGRLFAGGRSLTLPLQFSTVVYKRLESGRELPPCQFGRLCASKTDSALRLSRKGAPARAGRGVVNVSVD
jgi:hypothetical protein